MARQRLIVIGGNAAGMTAAAKARRLGGEDLEIMAFEKGRFTSYSTCGIPYFVGDLVHSEAELIARTPERLRRDGIDIHTQHTVLAIDPDNRRVQVVDEYGRERDEPYDQLLITSGAAAIRPDLPGKEARNIHGVPHLEAGLKVRRIVDEQKPKKAVVVGGGYIGLEMAEALILRGIETALIEKAPQVMGTLDPDMGALVSDALRQNGVRLHLEESLEEFLVRGDTVCGVRTDQRELEADLVILGLGVRPETTLAEAAGIPLGVKGAIRVNSRQQTAVAGIWAAGDCAESFHLISRQPVNIALGTIANKQGLVAGTNLGGGYATFPGVVGTAVSKICKYEVARTGLQEKEIKALGLEYESATIDSKTRAGYYPDAGDIKVKLLAERGSGRLLGGQIVGIEGAAKRIDVLATALHAGFTVQQIVDLDLSYAPPFSPVWDPVQIAARVMVGKV